MKRISTLIIIWLQLQSAFLLFSQTDLLGFTIGEFVDGEESLQYCLYIPEEYTSEKQYPLLIGLHGQGERGNPRKIIKAYGLGTVLSSPKVQKQYPHILLLPICPPNTNWVDVQFKSGSYSITETPITSELKLLYKLIKQLEKDYSLDKYRYYLIGLSIGAYGVWDMISRFPQTFAAAIPMSGAGDPGTVTDLKEISLWIFHGAWDFYIPVDGAREMVRAFESIGIEFNKGSKINTPSFTTAVENGSTKLYTEIRSPWHIIWSPIISDPLIHRWLFAQHRK